MFVLVHCCQCFCAYIVVNVFVLFVSVCIRILFASAWRWSCQVAVQITNKYDLPDKSKALRCLLDYVEEKESDWDDMFATVRCNRCG